MTHTKTALITGATSGIGRAFAQHFAARGYDLIITGRRNKIITSVAEELKEKYNIGITVVLADFTNENDILGLVKTVKKTDSIRVLVNNAGFGYDGIFPDVAINQHMDMIKVHISASVLLTHAVLPAMIQSREGIIINISSLGAFVPMPINGIYGGTKAFLNIFTESLFLEVRKKGIKVQSLCPGFTATDFHSKMEVEEDIKKKVRHWMTPESVVDYSTRCLARNKTICIPGWRNRLLYAFIKLVPRRLLYMITGRLSEEK